ncbi:MAG: hypothetical protein C4B59_04050 [Candidatus Methanogaster sp.]|uniref:Uncharacterized protein n=2 Tax=Candidatus Methanogaster sp. TaxID=3386292 RepID=A0AC61L4Y8_9EURY|nr:MAG: hypothetical protein C4B59_04030 [ANME-2 cluster archaeon]PXF61418.1 MAG: hypothetical protein C4B59_04050 [ANME-2 cluster archaeon]
MNKITKASLALAVIFIAILLVIFAQSLADEKKEYATDPVIAHIPLRADLGFPEEPILNRTVDVIYTLNPLVDMKVNVSESLILPEGIEFVENNLPIGQITLKKGKRYRYSAKIKTVEIGNWMIYAAPGVYADVSIFEDRASVGIRKVFKATVPLTRFHLRGNVSDGQRDILMNTTKNWLQKCGVREYVRELFNCSRIGGSHIIPCYGCELKCYSNSTLCDRYYFVIEEDQHTNKTKIRNVYRWAYQTPSGYQQKPVCEEVMANAIG